MKDPSPLRDRAKYAIKVRHDVERTLGSTMKTSVMMSHMRHNVRVSVIYDCLVTTTVILGFITRHRHNKTSGPSVSKNNIRVLSREQEWHRRKVKEAIYIKQHGPTMNRDQGNQLPPIYNQILPPVSGSSHRQQPMRDQDL